MHREHQYLLCLLGCINRMAGGSEHSIGLEKCPELMAFVLQRDLIPQEQPCRGRARHSHCWALGQAGSSQILLNPAKCRLG